MVYRMPRLDNCLIWQSAGFRNYVIRYPVCLTHQWSGAIENSKDDSVFCSSLARHSLIATIDHREYRCNFKVDCEVATKGCLVNNVTIGSSLKTRQSIILAFGSGSLIYHALHIPLQHSA